MNINLTYTTMKELPPSAVVRPGAIFKIRSTFMERCSYVSEYLLVERGDLIDISNTPSRGKEIPWIVPMAAYRQGPTVETFLTYFRQTPRYKILEIATSEGVWSLEPLVFCAAEKQE